MIHDWGQFLFDCLYGGAMYWVGWRAHKKEVEHPYKYKCKKCGFFISSNYMTALDGMASSHEKAHEALEGK